MKIIDAVVIFLMALFGSVASWMITRFIMMLVIKFIMSSGIVIDETQLRRCEGIPFGIACSVFVILSIAYYDKKLL